jgi:hypothetical protein
MEAGGVTATSVANGYPPDWKAISLAIRKRAQGQCECWGECGLHRTHPGPRRCQERQGEGATWAKGRIMLTVAHLNHEPADCRPENLKAMCQRCHLRYDIAHHRETRTARRRREAAERGQLGMLA